MFSLSSFPRVKKRKAISKDRPAVRLRKLTGSNPFTSVRMYKGIQPTTQNIKLKYVEYFNIAAVTSTSAPIQIGYRNSIFAPKVGGGGHQPMGRDEIADLYKRYQVMGMKYKVSMTNDSSSQMVFNVYNFHDSITALTDTEQMGELGNHRNVIVGRSDGNAGVRSAEGYIDLSRLSGQPRHAYMGNSRYQADIGASPDETLGFVWTYQTLVTPGTTQFNFDAYVEITYYVRFLEKKIQHSKS